jgi:hypothetical protein
VEPGQKPGIRPIVSRIFLLSLMVEDPGAHLAAELLTVVHLIEQFPELGSLIANG